VNIGKDTVRKIVVEDCENGRFVRTFFHTLWLKSRKTIKLQLAEIWFQAQTVILTSLRGL
jgi:hypothetical protein